MLSTADQLIPTRLSRIVQCVSAVPHDDVALVETCQHNKRNPVLIQPTMLTFLPRTLPV
jgi:hypothetical protein